jgi:hypothetical protein
MLEVRYKLFTGLEGMVGLVGGKDGKERAG